MITTFAGVEESGHSLNKLKLWGLIKGCSCGVLLHSTQCDTDSCTL